MAELSRIKEKNCKVSVATHSWSFLMIFKLFFYLLITHELPTEFNSYCWKHLFLHSPRELKKIYLLSHSSVMLSKNINDHSNQIFFTQQSFLMILRQKMISILFFQPTLNQQLPYHLLLTFRNSLHNRVEFLHSLTHLAQQPSLHLRIHLGL